MRWLDVNKKGKPLTFKVSTAPNLKAPNESLLWYAGGECFSSDIEYSCCKEHYRAGRCHSRPGVDRTTWRMTYTEEYIRCICRRKEGE